MYSIRADLFCQIYSSVSFIFMEPLFRARALHNRRRWIDGLLGIMMKESSFILINNRHGISRDG